MRTIPASMRLKLLNRIQATSTESEPSIRVVATQASTNILLTEPIHEDVIPAYGDVALQQTAGKSSIELAYAICLDSGIATIYRRKFPATMDYEWEYVWEFGEADDVAIEYDGSWTMDGSREWYYLVTEQYPYIFTVEDGDLYVQKWRDTSTRLLLAENVSCISACKGWFDSVNQDNDQGLIIGYIRNGEVYYRTLAYQTLIDDKVWEPEQKVTVLESGNSTLSIVRTNDFRVGFLTEQSGHIKMAITKRTYPGASVRPEYMHVSTYATFSNKEIRNRYGETSEYASVSTPKAFCMFDSDDHRMVITGAERLFSEDEYGEPYCCGAIIYLDRPLLTDITPVFRSRCTVSSAKLLITNVVYDEENCALVYSFDWAPGQTPTIHPVPFDLTFPTCYDTVYDALDGQIWYIEGRTVSLEAITYTRLTFENEYISIQTPSATMLFQDVEYIYTGDKNCRVSIDTEAEVSYIPVGDIPV